MTPPRGYSRDGDDVVLRMSQDDHDLLLICIGCAAGGALKYSAMALVNRLKRGTPADQWTPYAIPEEPKSGL